MTQLTSKIDFKQIVMLALGASFTSLLTGFHGGHSPIRGNPKWTNSGRPVDLKPQDITIAEMLKSNGYNTAAIAKWPNAIKANTTSDHISALWDMMPTFCQLAGGKQCPATDGISMVNTLLGENQQEKHEYLYWEFNESQGPLQAIKQGDWKLVKQFEKPIELYDLSKDIGESHNIADDFPDIVQQLSAKISSARTYHPEFTLKKLPNPWKKKSNKK